VITGWGSEAYQAIADALEGWVDVASFAPARAELCWRIAACREQQGDEDSALKWLRVAIEADARGPVLAAAWRRFVEMAARRGDVAAAAQGLVGNRSGGGVYEGRRGLAA
jgi:hypothetical protein